MTKTVFDVEQIDAWRDGDAWTWNASFYAGAFETKARNEKRALCNYLRRQHGIVFKKNRTRIVSDGSVVEILDRKTREPLFAAIAREY